MTNPKQALFWMTTYLVAVVLVCVVIFEPLKDAFLANWVFNALIVAVLWVGIGFTYRQVFALKPELQWISSFRTGRTGMSVEQEPKLLKPLAKQLGDEVKKDRFSMNAMSLRTVLDGIRSRLDESREISRYLISLLIFLGLLGTFWGLLGTIQSVGKVIIGLDTTSADFNLVFAELQAGLLKPLEGMGTAFSSSLLGLAGSLILGFLDIQAGHAQNRFYDGLEEWLTGLTSLVDVEEYNDLADHLGKAATRPEDLAEQMHQLIEENKALKDQLGAKAAD